MRGVFLPLVFFVLLLVFTILSSGLEKNVLKTIVKGSRGNGAVVRVGSDLVNEGSRRQRAIRNDDINAHSTAFRRGYCSSHAFSSETIMDRSTDAVFPGGRSASRLNLSQGLLSSVLTTRKCNTIAVDVFLGIASAAIVSCCCCLCLFTVEVLFAVAIVNSREWTEGTKEDSIVTNAFELAGNFFTTMSLSRAGHFHRENSAARLYHKCWNFVGSASAAAVARMSEGVLVLCFVAVATFVYTSVSERFMRLAVDVFLQALTTSRTQNCTSICSSPSRKKALHERRFSGLRSFGVSPTETAQNESFTERNKVDFLQKLATWSEATDDWLLPSARPFICTPEHWEETQRFRGDNEASASGRSRTKGRTLYYTA